MACLPHELIVWEILVRLPVKSLLRLRCVCKAWRDAVSDPGPSFSQAHLRRLHQHDNKLCSLLIAPRIISDVDVASNTRRPWLPGKVTTTTPGLYLWEEGQQDLATLLHDTSSYPAEQAAMRHVFVHCDGLVLLPTEDTVCVLNPTTRQVLELPWSPNSIAPRRRLVVKGHQAFGFGRDHCSNAYKVARFFYRQTSAMGGLGMEVFTIGKDNYWHETSTQPPYPFFVRKTATFFKGSLIWTVDQFSLMYDRSLLHDLAVGDMTYFVRFSLVDESFNNITGPPWFEGPDYLESSVAELNGELAILRLGPNYETIEIWMCDDVEGKNPQRWEQRHAFEFPSSLRLIAIFDDEIVYQDGSSYLSRQTSQGNNIMVDMIDLKYYNPYIGTLVQYSWGAVEDFDVIFFIPTLVQI